MSWPTIKLGDVCQFVRGPFGGALKKEFFVKHGYAVYEQQHAIYDQFEKIRYFVSEDKFNEMKRFELHEGDLIMSCSGTMGKVAIVPANIKKGIINQALLKLTPTNKLELKFLKLYMESELFQRALNENAHGAAIKNVASVSILKDIKIKLPPLAEQKRIAAVLDKADEIKRKREQAIAKLDQLAQSIFVEMFGGELSWQTVKLGDVCDVRDGTHDSPKYIESGYPLITSKNLVAGFIDKSNVSYISEEDYKNICKRSKVDFGDILMPMIGTIGNPVIVNEKQPDFAIKNVALIKFNKESPSCSFIKSVLTSQLFHSYIDRASKGGTQKFLSLGDIRKFPFPLPPIALQEQFATRISKLEKLKASNIAALEKHNQLFASLQNQAFTGQL